MADKSLKKDIVEVLLFVGMAVTFVVGTVIGILETVR